MSPVFLTTYYNRQSTCSQRASDWGRVLPPAVLPAQGVHTSRYARLNMHIEPSMSFHTLDDFLSTDHWRFPGRDTVIIQESLKNVTESRPCLPKLDVGDTYDAVRRLINS